MALCSGVNPKLRKYVLDIVGRAYDGAQKIELDVINDISIDEAVTQTLTLTIKGFLWNEDLLTP